MNCGWTFFGLSAREVCVYTVILAVFTIVRAAPILHTIVRGNTQLGANLQPAWIPSETQTTTLHLLAMSDVQEAKFFGSPRPQCNHEVPPFSCKKFDDEDGIPYENRTASVVRHQDIRVVGIIGDSISAGFAMVSARPPSTAVFEYRGKVFNGGSDDDEVTLSNMLRNLSGKPVLGAARFVTVPLARGKDMNRAVYTLFSAVSGATTSSLPSQSRDMVSLFSLPPYYSRRNDWKLVTVLIGGNNLCRICLNDNKLDYLKITHDVRTALLNLRNAHKKWIVNLVGMFQISDVFEAAQKVPYCKLVFERFHFCPCIHRNESRHQMDALVPEFNINLESLAKEFDGDPSFKVIFQPGLTEMSIAPFGQEFLSNLDCFHPNLCANRVMAATLWNNMVEAPGTKSTKLDPYNVKWKCPSKQNMYIQ